MTPTELLQGELGRFLASKTPEVLCIRGDWGVGKTFTWQLALKNAVAQKRLGLTRYAYVSLFGINSLDSLKLATFENHEFLLPENDESGSDQIKRQGNRLFNLFRKSKDVASTLPWVGDILRNAGTLYFSLVREQIICVDDLERRSTQLTVKDVLGLISFLKEQRSCKIVILLNDQQLTPQDRNEFEQYFEKVIDISLRFAPLPEDSIRIALTADDPASSLIGECCVALRISNIRVIKKIERLVHDAADLVAEFDGQVFGRAVRTLTLLGWSKYQPSIAPPLEALKTRTLSAYASGEISAQTASWNALLDAYGFTSIDDFDLALADGIENGFFDPARIRETAAKLDRQIQAERKDQSFDAAWRMYHDSFDNNEAEALAALMTAVKSGVQSVSPADLNGTVSLFKELGHPEQAREILDYYLQNRSEAAGFWDLEAYPFAVDDADLRAAFAAKHSDLAERPDPAATLLKIATQDSWSESELAVLAETPTARYRAIFKAHKGRNLWKLVSAALQFDRTTDASPAMRAIASNAKAALALIGRESPINARRVRKYGIKPEPDATPAATDKKP